MADIRVDRLSILNPPVAAGTPKKADEAQPAQSFGAILDQELGKTEGIKFSKHAQMRLSSRDIALAPEDLTRLTEVVEKASAKGVHDSLVLLRDVAFIVSVPGRTVVTAMPVDEAEGNVFTNLDGAVILL